MKKLILFVTSLLILPTLYAQNTNNIPFKIQNFIANLEDETANVQGGAIAILYKGEVIYQSTFGYRQGKTGAITSKTLFSLGSVSKPVSAMAVALLIDSGAIDLNQKLKMSYLKHEINLTHILSHTTGYHFPGNPQIERGMQRHKLLEQLKYEQPKCSPGECYRYSNTTFSLVEEVLNTRQLSLDNAIQNLQMVLGTDGIQTIPIDAGIDVAHPHVKYKGQKSKTNKLKTLPLPPYYPKATPAAAGLFASLDGMVEIFKLSFGYRPDLISQATLRKFHTPIIANRDPEKWPNLVWPCGRKNVRSYYGLGWRILQSNAQPNKKLICHSGFLAGVSTFIGFMPEDEVGLIILFNQNSPVPFKKGIALWGKFLKNI
jgi:beta-lactamase class C